MRKATRKANYSIKIPFITFSCENRIKQRTQIIIITNNANNNSYVCVYVWGMREKRIENVAGNVWKILKTAAPQRTKNYFTFKLAVILLKICFPLSLYIFSSYYFTLFLSFLFLILLTHWLTHTLSLSRVRALFIIQQGRKKCILFNKRSANLYDGNWEHFYSLIFILTTSIYTRERESYFILLSSSQDRWKMEKLFLPFLFYYFLCFQTIHFSFIHHHHHEDEQSKRK